MIFSPCHHAFHIPTILGAFMLCHTKLLQTLTITYFVFCFTIANFIAHLLFSAIR